MSLKPPPWYASTEGKIAILSVVTLILSVALRFSEYFCYSDYPLFICYIFGGLPLLFELLKKTFKRQFGSDLLAGISIVTSLILGEYLAGTFVVLMLSGGEALEAYALRRASSVLDALSKRMPNETYRRTQDKVEKITLDSVTLDDLLEVRPHDICPVDGIVTEGSSNMDESYLTGEPYQINKIPGSNVFSGTINGDGLLLIKPTALPVDSRYQKIAKVIEEQQRDHVPLKRLGDLLGAWYTPLALAIAIIAWIISGDAIRFLAVLVIATPCPLIIAIPVALIGTISEAARRGIIIKVPSSLEVLSKCKTIIFDKTGTLTYGKPALTEIVVADKNEEDSILSLLASLESYSKHPLAEAVVQAAKNKKLPQLRFSSISEKPGEGLKGQLEGSLIQITGRSKIDKNIILPDALEGLECIALRDGEFLALLRFRDTPRKDSKTFVKHLSSHHGIEKIKILSGDRIEEVKYLAKQVGIEDVQGSLTPEEKISEVKREMALAPVAFVGDGINDAPALQVATVGIAVGTKSDITSEAADVVVLDASLSKVDELLHLSFRFRSIALQSAIGGMAVSVIGMILGAIGLISPLTGALTQEIIDVLAVTNALRTSFPDRNKSHI